MSSFTSIHYPALVEKNTHKSSRQFNKISFYVVAHADDWQLFMHPTVYADLVATDCKVVFIITTAGDAGMGDNYWPAREEGLKSSIRFCLAPHSVLSESSGKKTFNNHSVHYWSVNNTTSYFLRLPDGNLDGSAFSSRNFQSLARFKSGEINAVNSIDNATTYHNWKEFINSVDSIISMEKRDLSNGWIHYLNPDETINPGDHSDHVMTGRAIQSMPSIATLHQVLFVGYSVSDVHDDRPVTDLFWKAGMLAAYEKAVYDLCGYSTLRENPGLYVKWCCSRPKFLMILPTD